MLSLFSKLPPSPALSLFSIPTFSFWEWGRVDAPGMFLLREGEHKIPLFFLLLTIDRSGLWSLQDPGGAKDLGVMMEMGCSCLVPL